MATRDIVLDKGLPVNTDAERLILGAILTDESAFIQVAGILEGSDFSLEKHRRIFTRMAELQDRGEKIDRITLTNELMKQGQLEAVDGFSYIVSLDDGLPTIHNLEGYVRIVKDKATLRRLVFASQSIIDRCMLDQEEPATLEMLGAYLEDHPGHD